MKNFLNFKSGLKAVCSLVLAGVLFLQVACAGPLAQLENIMPFVPVAVEGLVATGAINQALGDKIENDFESVSGSVNTAKVKLSQIASDDPQKKAKETLVYVELGNKWREVISRNHFAEASNPKIDAIVNTVTKIMDILIARNGGQPAGARGAAIDTSDKALQDNINELDKLVKSK